MFAFPIVLFPLQLFFNVFFIYFYLTLHIYFSFFSFFPFLLAYLLILFLLLYSPLGILLLFCFQFVLKIVLFLTGEYNFSFPLFTNLLYFIFVGLFSLCSWVYMCILHYFDYYLPDFFNCHFSGVCLWFLIFGYLFYSPLMS